MKYEYLHKLNRSYVSDPKKQININFALKEDIITPQKVYDMLLSHTTRHREEDFYFAHISDNKNYIDEYGLTGVGYYAATYDLNMFQEVFLHDDYNGILSWLNKYWTTEFIITTPMYEDYQGNTIICNHDTNQSIYINNNMDEDTITRLLNGNHFSIGNGLTIALSLNAIGVWNDATFFNVLLAFLQDKPELVLYDYSIWINNFGSNNNDNHIYEYPLVYAFQFCKPNIYGLIYNIDSDAFSFGAYYNNLVNNRIYIFNLHTSLLQPKKHHYEFLEDIFYQSTLIFIWPHVFENKYIKYDMHSIICSTLNSSWYRNSLLQNGIIYDKFKNNILTIYKPTSYVNIIRSISYLYHQKNTSKRLLKLVWRKLINIDQDNFYNYSWLYNLVYYTSCNHIDCFYPLPNRYLKDIIYLGHNKYNLFNPIKLNFNNISNRVHLNIIDNMKNYNNELFKKIYNNFQSSNKILIISPHEIMKFCSIVNNRYKNLDTHINKKYKELLLCLRKNNYILYDVMRNYYENNKNEIGLL